MLAVTWELRGDSSGIAWWFDYSVLHAESRLQYAQQKYIYSKIMFNATIFHQHQLNMISSVNYEVSSDPFIQQQHQ